VSVALQVVALLTETVPLPPFAMYSVRVAGSVMAPVGLAPACPVAAGGRGADRPYAGRALA